MNTCWKCGKQSADEYAAECDQCSGGVTSSESSGSNAVEPPPPDPANPSNPALDPRIWRFIDWQKVNTIEDIKEIMQHFGLRVLRGSLDETKLNRFLKP